MNMYSTYSVISKTNPENEPFVIQYTGIMDHLMIKLMIGKYDGSFCQAHYAQNNTTLRIPPALRHSHQEEEQTHKDTKLRNS